MANPFDLIITAADDAIRLAQDPHALPAMERAALRADIKRRMGQQLGPAIELGRTTNHNSKEVEDRLARLFDCVESLFRQHVRNATEEVISDSIEQVGHAMQVVWMLKKECDPPQQSSPPQVLIAANDKQVRGYFGGRELVNELGILEANSDAFFKQLERSRPALIADGACLAIADSGPNRPKFVYRVDSDAIREIAAKYQSN